MLWHRIPAMTIASLFLVVSFGCSSSDKSEYERAVVTGKVTYDKQALDEGTINFSPAGDNKGPSTGGVIKNGTFLISDVVVGKQRVEIHGNIKTGQQIPAVLPAPPGSMIEVTKDVPSQYNSESALEITVNSGENTFNFPLSSQ